MHITTNRPDFQTFQGPFRLSNQSPFSHPDDLFSRNSARPNFFFYNFDVSSKIIFQFNFCMISQFCCIFFPSLNQKFWKSEILLELGKSGFWKMKRLICNCNGGSWIRNSKSKLQQPTPRPNFHNFTTTYFLFIYWFVLLRKKGFWKTLEICLLELVVGSCEQESGSESVWNTIIVEYFLRPNWEEGVDFKLRETHGKMCW